MKLEDIINKIICGDALLELKKLPDESIDLIITSPPYYGLRNYQVDGQIGLEKTFEEYLKKILEITAELKRVLKKTGTFFLNMGDCYGTHNSGGKGHSHNFKKEDIGQSWNKPKQNLSEKCMLMQPERLAIKMIDEQGWILRNKIKWAKQVLIKKQNRTIGSVMPTSVKDRFNESGEELYFFVKSKKYYSNLDVVRLPNQVLGVTDFREDTHHLGSGFVRTPELYPNSKYRGKFRGNENAESFNSPRVRTQRNKVNDPRGNHEGVPGSWRDFKDNPENSFPKFQKRKNIEVLNGRRRDISLYERMGENIQGKNLPTIWLIGSEPHNFQKEVGASVDHFAVFPEALCEIPIKFGCPKNGIVLDCFSGSGTALIVAKKLGRNFIGIEISPAYCKIAEERLRGTPSPMF